MTVRHVEFLVEEPSMEEFLRELLPRLLPRDRTFAIHSFRGKSDLLRKLAARLRSYSKWLPVDWRIVVMVDRDPDSIPHTWEAFERILKRHRYFTTGLRKREAARKVAAKLVPDRNRSHSFRVFLDVIREAAAGPPQCEA